ncbi:coiled-coil domain-containing protein 13-like [Hetaerina americana]|uniref:coiled-coil domain-containing protein 13-like n=1 Tax=Hetaerina americana TaxID=62018 RepID=UPI003A7F0F31
MSQGDLKGQGDMSEKESSKREQERRAAELARLEASLEEVGRQANEWKRKSEVNKARLAAKQAEMEALKSRLSIIQTKTEQDGQLIKSLSECLRNKECTIRDKEAEIKATKEEQKREKEDLNVQLMKVQAKVNNLEDELHKKNLMIEKLHQARGDQAVVADSRENKLETNGASSYSTSSEHELRIITQATEAERQRLLELVAVLNKRLKEEQSQTDQAMRQLKIEKRKNAILESKVAFLELESTPGRNNSYYKSSSRKSSSNNNKQVISDDIKHRLEYLEEEKIVLESRIECLKEEKEEDLKHYSMLLRDTQELFQAKLQEMEYTEPYTYKVELILVMNINEKTDEFRPTYTQEDPYEYVSL